MRSMITRMSSHFCHGASELEKTSNGRLGNMGRCETPLSNRATSSICFPSLSAARGGIKAVCGRIGKSPKIAGLITACRTLWYRRFCPGISFTSMPSCFEKSRTQSGDPRSLAFLVNLYRCALGDLFLFLTKLSWGSSIPARQIMNEARLCRNFCQVWHNYSITSGITKLNAPNEG